ncbi:uncharacterized protein I303_107474 [Kwoniella dejecticola CBS 10117]|uniref:NADPH-dependent FMN reductase-like domain-containing protein n=1 Tax=Kwoniella dejecticola CBS 10117 TaxID=1296121 RepID=A0A1A5ZZS8_9TREE|nr:uncharacterized protein I303_06879 [Kwoniella dejecticola CBS 10117]OBR83314.1 hypothetical protein I303_06879 [Kwoniella dejecticola CBS 10117]
MPYKIGIILGSTRTHSNSEGILKYFTSSIIPTPNHSDTSSESELRSNTQSQFESESNSGSEVKPEIEFEIIHLNQSPGHPLPLLLDEVIPQAHPKDHVLLPQSYSDPSIQKWSETVEGWDGVLILTPQYNWGYPAPLKNALDHLYHEWTGKPFALITLGGHGGSKVHDQLLTVLEGGLKMRSIDKSRHVQIILPREFITSSERVKGDEEWLCAYKEQLEGLVDALKLAVEEKKR